jgi:hypothetical protein
MQGIIGIIGLTAVVMGALVGMVYSFVLAREARLAGYGTALGRFSGIDALRFAFSERKGSPETRTMLTGWTVMTCGFLVCAVARAVLAP